MHTANIQYVLAIIIATVQVKTIKPGEGHKSQGNVREDTNGILTISKGF